MPRPDSTDDAASPPRPSAPASRTRRATRLALALAALAALVTLGRLGAAAIPDAVGRIEDAGPLAPVLFVAGYAVACVLLVPASLLTLAAGAVFGLASGIALVLAGATLGAAASFLIARHVARDAVVRRLRRTPRLAAIDRLVGADGRRIVLLMRLSPLFPFAALNYALGVTRLRFRDFLAAMVGIVPGTVLYVYTGTVAGTVAGIGAGATERGLAHHLLLAAGLLATFVVTLLITRAARRALAEAHPATDERDGGAA